MFRLGRFDLQHSQAHDGAEASLLVLAHVDPSNEQPREERKDEIHHDIIDFGSLLVKCSAAGVDGLLTVSSLLEVVPESLIEADIQSVVDVCAL